MQPDTESTSTHLHGPEYVLTLAIHDLINLFRTKNSEDPFLTIDKQTILLEQVGVWEHLIKAYRLLGERISMALLKQRELELRLDLAKRTAMRGQKREELRVLPTP
jgi:hypothetical protein